MEHNAGEIIERAIRKQNANISELSKRLKVNRRTIYSWFRQKKLHIDVILEIGKAINYNFSHEFNGQLDYFDFEEERKQYIKYEHSTDANTVYYWMEKYISLLEDYKTLAGKIESQNMLS